MFSSIIAEFIPGKVQRFYNKESNRELSLSLGSVIFTYMAKSLNGFSTKFPYTLLKTI